MQLTRPRLLAGRALPLAAACVCLLAVGAAFGARAADGASVKVFGAAAPATATCPVGGGSDQCFVEAKVTGFQSRIAGKRNPFVAPWKGRVVAWSVKLGRPTKKQNGCLSKGCVVAGNRFPGFGGPASARLSILRPERKNPKRFKLISESPKMELTNYFGQTVTFQLAKSLAVSRRDVVALTIPTWAPLFAGSLDSGSVWQASRKPTRAKGACTKQGSANVSAGSSFEKVGGRRVFGCSYKSNRLLYSATVVRKPEF